MTRAEELVLRLADGALAPDEVAELEALVAADPEAARLYRAALELEAALRGLRADIELTDATLARVREVETGRESGVMARVATAPKPAWAGRRWRWSVAVGVAAAAAVLVAVWLGNPPTTNPPAAVAELRVVEAEGESTVAAVGGAESAAAAGRELVAGEQVQTRGEVGSAVVEFRDGTRMELGSDTRVRFDEVGPTGKRVVLAEGRLRVRAAPQPADRPLVVRTPQAEVRVVGTVFDLDAHPTADTRLELEHGRVEVRRLVGGDPVTVEAGQAVVVSADLPPLVRRLPGLLRGPGRSVDFASARLLRFRPAGELLAASDRAFAVFPAAGDRPTVRVSSDPGTWGPTAHDPAAHLFVASRQPRTIGRWDAATGRKLSESDAGTTRIRAVAVAPGGARVAVADTVAERTRARGVVSVWDADGSAVWRKEHDAEVLTLTFTADGRELVVGPKGGVPLRWAAATGAAVGSLPESGKGVRLLVLSADGRRLLTRTEDRGLCLWDTAPWRLARTLPAPAGPVDVAAFSADGRLVAGGTANGLVRVWDAETAAEVAALDLGRGRVQAVAFTPDGGGLVVGTQEGPPRWWELP